MVQILASMSVMSDLSREDIETMPTPEIGAIQGSPSRYTGKPKPQYRGGMVGGCAWGGNGPYFMF